VKGNGQVGGKERGRGGDRKMEGRVWEREVVRCDFLLPQN